MSVGQKAGQKVGSTAVGWVDSKVELKAFRLVGQWAARMAESMVDARVDSMAVDLVDLKAASMAG